MAITYIANKDIDITKWDTCLSRSFNKVIYAQRFYLDQMASNWDALVLNDYEAIMPLPWRKKWGFRYLYQPAFTQQGGVFSMCPLGVQTLSEFMTEARAKFKFAEFTGNSGVLFPPSDNYTLVSRLNLTLKLSDSHPEHILRYDSITKKNLKRASNTDLKYLPSADYIGIIEFYRQQYETRLPDFDAGDYKKFEKICDKLFSEKNLICRTVVQQSGNVVAGVVLLKDHHRLYNLISAVNAEGRKTQANYLLYDKMIEEFCGQSLILDFEGSDIPGIAEFYKRFNPEAESYQFVRFNNLPGPLKFFKKRASL